MFWKHRRKHEMIEDCLYRFQEKFKRVSEDLKTIYKDINNLYNLTYLSIDIDNVSGAFSWVGKTLKITNLKNGDCTVIKAKAIALSAMHMIDENNNRSDTVQLLIVGGNDNVCKVPLKDIGKDFKIEVVSDKVLFNEG